MGRSEMQPLLGTVDEAGFVWTVPRQQFVKLYVATGDGKAAARDAKLPEDDNWADLLEHDSVKQAIAALHEQVLRRVHESADTITSRYSNIAEGNIADYVTASHADGGRVRAGDIHLKDFRAMPRHMQQRIKKLKVTTTGGEHPQTNFEIELHDPMKANDALVRLLGLDKVDDNDDAKDFAQQILDFRTELENLDSHYDDPDKPDG